MAMKRKGPPDSRSQRPSTRRRNALYYCGKYSTPTGSRLALIRDTRVSPADVNRRRLARVLHTLGVGVGAKVGSRADVLKILEEGRALLGRPS